jgi:hypothetical protein
MKAFRKTAVANECRRFAGEGKDFPAVHRMFATIPQVLKPI